MSFLKGLEIFKNYKHNGQQKEVLAKDFNANNSLWGREKMST